jgi:hypothetical protein
MIADQLTRCMGKAKQPRRPSIALHPPLIDIRSARYLDALAHIRKHEKLIMTGSATTDR